MAYTKGPWFYTDLDSADFTVISTKPEMPFSDYKTDRQGNPVREEMDLENEVLGSSEWCRAEKQDLILMAASPELYEALKELVKCNDTAGSDPAVSQWIGSPVRKQCVDLLAKLKEIEE